MKYLECERAWELDAHREGLLGPQDAVSHERHLRSCAECTARKASDQRLRELAGRLPDAEPDALSLRRMRRRVLNDAAMGDPRRPPMGRTAFLAAAALGVMAGAFIASRSLHRTLPLPVAAASAAAAPAASATVESSSGAADKTFAASVAPTQGARWTQTREGSAERVLLEDGTIDLHVRPQQTGERFLVVVPDGEIEVRGTTFEVSVAGGRTTGVQVSEGVVVVRIDGAPVRRLAPGERWPEAADTTTTLPAASRPPPVQLAQRSPPPGRSDASAVTARLGDTDEEAPAYAEAVRVLSAGRNEEAAAALRAFVEAHPNAAQAEDATFLEAVALARAGRTDAAGLAAEHHLTRFPSSFHRTEALILVDRAAHLRGSRDGGP